MGVYDKNMAKTDFIYNILVYLLKLNLRKKSRYLKVTLRRNLI